MLTALKQRFRTWLFRPKIESGTVTLTQRRIFILPTRQGIALALLLVLMLLGDINYNLSLGYVLTFLLAMMAVMSMLHAFRNLAQLEIRAGKVDAVFSDETARFLLHFRNRSGLPRYRLGLHDKNGHKVSFDVPAQQDSEIIFSLPATQRGWLALGQLTLSTEFPLGLFYAWSYLHFDTRCIVYPKPLANAPLPPGDTPDGAGRRNIAGDDDFAGLRNYVAGDALPRIAWKAYAREQGLQVKQFSMQVGEELWLDFAAAPEPDTGGKLARMAHWVLDAESQGLRYGLRLPDGELPPGNGAAQRDECLRRLALFDLPNRSGPPPDSSPVNGRGVGERETMSKPLIYGLLLSILMVAAPHPDHLPLWVSALCAALLGWRAYLTYSGKPLPKHWLLLAITFAGVGGIAVSFHTLFGREVGVTLLILLATLKFMELRAARDATVLVHLACFIIITNFFYSQSIPTALYLLATLLAIVTTWIHLQAQTIALKPRLRIAATLLLQSIPLMLVLFVLFPRVQGPLWGLPQDAFASSGLSDKMAPGSLSRLSLSDAVAFRVSYQSQPPRREQMYWRGPVLWDFDGRTWTPGITTATIAPQFTELAQPVDYAVTLEPHNRTWLFTLDMPNSISVPAELTHDFQVVRKEPVHARLRYEARSHLGYHANVQEATRQIQRALQLPRKLNPRAQQLAAEWRASNINDADVVRAALTYFNQQEFSYTLEPPLLGLNTIDDFLFGSKQGFCEHYASTFVFLMRAAHIPARVVTGYQGGEYNALGNYYIVRQSDAHAWAEVWLAEQGWVRVDPTAAIAPARVQSGLSAALPGNAALPFMARNPPQWMLELRLNWDALANQWNQWVLGYNTERQFAFLTRLGMEAITWQKMATNMMIVVGLLVALFSLFMLRHLFAQQPDKVQAAWLKLCRKLAKAGLPRAPHEGALDYAARITAARPELAETISDLAARYSMLRYGNAREEQAQREFLQRAATFKA